MSALKRVKEQQEPTVTVKFRKQAPPCIRPSKYKPPKLVTEKTLLNPLSKYKPPGGLYLEIALKYKVKQGKNGKF